MKRAALALLLLSACTKSAQEDTRSASTKIAGNDLELIVESARSHDRDVGGKRVLVIWRLRNAGTADFQLDTYESDEFMMRTADQGLYQASVSMGTDRKTVLEPGGTVSFLSVIDAPADVNLNGATFGAVRKDGNGAATDVSTPIKLTVHNELTACDELSNACEAREDEDLPQCTALEGVTYPIAYPLKSDIAEKCKSRLAELVR